MTSFPSRTNRDEGGQRDFWTREQRYLPPLLPRTNRQRQPQTGIRDRSHGPSVVKARLPCLIRPWRGERYGPTASTRRGRLRYCIERYEPFRRNFFHSHLSLIGKNILLPRLCHRQHLHPSPLALYSQPSEFSAQQPEVCRTPHRLSGIATLLHRI